MDKVAESIDNFKELEDKRIWDYIDKHNGFLNQINEIDLDNSPPFRIAKAEYLYSRAQLYASLISGHYRKLQKYHEAMAEQEQANSYESTRLGDGPLKTGTDAQYLSRLAKGKELEIASTYDGDYVRWTGIAKSYESAINSLKDMIKSLEKENRGGV